MLSILKYGKLSQQISVKFDNFLTRLTFMLFVTEVERNPAALIHNIMALDLMENNFITSWNEIFEILPMCLKGAVQMARHIQYTSQRKFLFPYKYDLCKDFEKSDKLIDREFSLFKQWLISKNISVNSNFIPEINNLCYHYYGINLQDTNGNDQAYSNKKAKYE